MLARSWAASGRDWPSAVWELVPSKRKLWDVRRWAGSDIALLLCCRAPWQVQPCRSADELLRLHQGKSAQTWQCRLPELQSRGVAQCMLNTVLQPCGLCMQAPQQGASRSRLAFCRGTDQVQRGCGSRSSRAGVLSVGRWPRKRGPAERPQVQRGPCRVHAICQALQLLLSLCAGQCKSSRHWHMHEVSPASAVPARVSKSDHRTAMLHG